MARRRRAARAIGALLVVVDATGCPSAPTAPAPAAPSTAEVQSVAKPPASTLPPRAEARVLLAPYAVSHKTAGRATLYTWTTREQALELAQSHVLLTRGESPEHGSAYSDQILAERAKADPIAALLRTMPFGKMRYAWPAPWATLRGWPGESYGDVLITVTLKPDALIVRVRTSMTTIDVIDLAGNVVAGDIAPERIAAIYFVHDKPAAREYSGSWAGSYVAKKPARLAFREYVLCNESMIEEWSIGTAREREAIDRARDAIDALAEIAPDEAYDNVLAWSQRVSRAWSTMPASGSSAIATYEAGTAITNELYAPTPKNLRALAKALGSMPYDIPTVTHRPTTTFPRDLLRTPQPPVRIVTP